MDPSTATFSACLEIASWFSVTSALRVLKRGSGWQRPTTMAGPGVLQNRWFLLFYFGESAGPCALWSLELKIDLNN